MPYEHCNFWGSQLCLYMHLLVCRAAAAARDREEVTAQAALAARAAREAHEAAIEAARKRARLQKRNKGKNRKSKNAFAEENEEQVAENEVQAD